MIPPFVQVAGYQIEVVLAPCDDHGGFFPESLRIVLSDALPETQQRTVLFHELCEACFYLSGHSERMSDGERESLVIMLERLLLPAIDDAGL